jgi:signal peptidase I
MVWALVLAGCSSGQPVLSSSMVPALCPGDTVQLVERAPVRGDIVQYANGKTRGRPWLHRVVGVAGDEVGFDANVLVVNGTSAVLVEQGRGVVHGPDDREAAVAVFQEALLGRKRMITRIERPVRPDVPAITVPPGHVYVVGDNRGHSQDSRHLGTIALTDVQGVVEEPARPGACLKQG